MDNLLVFVTRELPPAGLARLREVTEAEIWAGDTPPPYETLLEKVQGIDGLLCLLTDRIDDELMAVAGSGLKVISQMAVGYDNIDIHAATRRGIPVGNTPDVLTETTADFAFTLMLAAARRVVEGEKYVRAGRWQTWGPTLFMGKDIHDATLGILGFGRIGQALARRARGFDMRVLFYDPGASEELGRSQNAEKRSFGSVLEEADFISIHTPLTPETTHLINAAALRRMKPSSVLINTSRGGTVDPVALFAALQVGDIAYAALDVTEPEPIELDDPLLTLENCLIVPHIASSSIKTRNKMALMAVANLEAGLSGTPLPNCVNPGVYG
jgi:glyoxylate reductase